VKPVLFTLGTLALLVSLTGSASGARAQSFRQVVAPAPATSLRVATTARVGKQAALRFTVSDSLAAFSYNVQVSAGTGDGKLVANTGVIVIRHKTHVSGSFAWTPKAKGYYTACVIGIDLGAASRNLGSSCKLITVR
jgi:hypothetical protein